MTGPHRPTPGSGCQVGGSDKGLVGGSDKGLGGMDRRWVESSRPASAKANDPADA